MNHVGDWAGEKEIKTVRTFLIANSADFCSYSVVTDVPDNHPELNSLANVKAILQSGRGVNAAMTGLDLKGYTRQSDGSYKYEVRDSELGCENAEAGLVYNKEHNVSMIKQNADGSLYTYKLNEGFAVLFVVPVWTTEEAACSMKKIE